MALFSTPMYFHPHSHLFATLVLVRVCVCVRVSFGCYPAHLFSASSGLLLRPLCAALPLNLEQREAVFVFAGPQQRC